MIKIISFVDSYKHFDKSIKEYEKRLWKSVNFQKLKPVKSTNPDEIIKKESLILNKILEKTSWYKVLLYIDSEELSTQKFEKFIEEKQVKYSDIVFIIWWAYWVDLEIIKNNIDFKLSFSPMTFPHIMAILILLEQIYRAKKIKEGWNYHH
jgi:23S rRNA (pseudouridine1915-N3)-methyltransferase